MKFLKVDKGITIISLVVTIIILIILTGVTMNLTIGQDGLIQKAEQEEEKIKETIEEKREEIKELEDALANNIKIIKISNAIKGKNKDDIIGYEDYVGDFIKIGETTLSSLNLEYTGEYFVNVKTGEVYDINGEEKNGITYHTLEQYYQILNSNNLETTKKLMEINEMHIQAINDSQYESGAYATYSKSNSTSSKVVPYFNCVGLLGLMNDIPSLEGIQKYIQWHFDHVNSEDSVGSVGSIYDYYITPDEVETSDTANQYDSIDSYASLFFILLNEYYNKTGDIEIFEDNLEEFQKVEQALNNMFNYNNDGTYLTLTKPQYPVYYLMDNCESYAGYISLANIYEKVYEDTEKAELYRERAQLIKKAIEDNLWAENESNPEFSNYDYALQNSSYNGLFFDKTYYPYVIAQIYPVLYNVVNIDTERSEHLYFLHQYYSNSQEESTGLWYTFKHKGTSYPHFESLYVALMYKDTTFNARISNYEINVEYEIEQAISNIRSDFNADQTQYPWTIAERGYIIRSLNLYMNK